MTTPLLTPPSGSRVSLGSGWKVDAKVLVAPFGDGYEQSSRDGINNIRRKGTIVFAMSTPEAASEIEAFLEARGGTEPFLFALPRETSPRKWTCSSWSRSYDFRSRDTIQAEFTESFAP